MQKRPKRTGTALNQMINKIILRGTVMHSIGVIRSPFSELSNMPIQPKGASQTEGKVIVESQFEEGLRDIEGFSALLPNFWQKKQENRGYNSN